MRPLKFSVIKDGFHRCSHCGLEWHGLLGEEECPLARLEEEFFTFEDTPLAEEEMFHSPILLM